MTFNFSDRGGQSTAFSLHGLEGRSATGAATASSSPLFSTQAGLAVIDVDPAGGNADYPFQWPRSLTVIGYDVLVVSNGGGGAGAVLLPSSLLVPAGTTITVINTSGTQAVNCRDSADAATIFQLATAAGADVSTGMSFVNLDNTVANGWEAILSLGS